MKPKHLLTRAHEVADRTDGVQEARLRRKRVRIVEGLVESVLINVLRQKRLVLRLIDRLYEYE